MIRIFRGLEFQIWALHPVVEDTTLGCLSILFTLTTTIYLTY
ncbi:unnamed protein product, partial [Brassica oleracea]